MTAPCCELHLPQQDDDPDPYGQPLREGGVMARCCDGNDCAPCCMDCPTCPTVAAARADAMVPSVPHLQSAARPTSHRKPTQRWPGILAAGVAAAVLGAVVWATRPAPVDGQPLASPTTESLAADGSASRNGQQAAATSTPSGDGAPTSIDDADGSTTTPIGGPGGIRPGLWQTEGGPRCRWSVDRGASWSPDTGGAPTGRLRVWLRGERTYFSTQGCGSWKWVGN